MHFLYKNKIEKLLDNLLLGKRFISENDEVRDYYHINKLEIGYSINGSDRYITIYKIIIQKEYRGDAYGSMVLDEICDWADEYGKVLCVTPDDSFGTPIRKLDKWYYK